MQFFDLCRFISLFCRKGRAALEVRTRSARIEGRRLSLAARADPATTHADIPTAVSRDCVVCMEHFAGWGEATLEGNEVAASLPMDREVTVGDGLHSYIDHRTTGLVKSRGLASSVDNVLCTFVQSVYGVVAEAEKLSTSVAGRCDMLYGQLEVDFCVFAFVFPLRFICLVSFCFSISLTSLL